MTTRTCGARLLAFGTVWLSAICNAADLPYGTTLNDASEFYMAVVIKGQTCPTATRRRAQNSAAILDASMGRYFKQVKQIGAHKYQDFLQGALDAKHNCANIAWQLSATELDGLAKSIQQALELTVSGMASLPATFECPALSPVQRTIYSEFLEAWAAHLKWQNIMQVCDD